MKLSFSSDRYISRPTCRNISQPAKNSRSPLSTMAFHRSLQNCMLKRPEHTQNHESLTNLQQPKSSMLCPPCLSLAASHSSSPRVVLPLFASLLSPLPVCPVLDLSISWCGRFVNFPFFIYHGQRKIDNWSSISWVGHFLDLDRHYLVNLRNWISFGKVLLQDYPKLIITFRLFCSLLKQKLKFYNVIFNFLS